MITIIKKKKNILLLLDLSSNLFQDNSFQNWFNNNNRECHWSIKNDTMRKEIKWKAKKMTERIRIVSIDAVVSGGTYDKCDK